MGNPSNATGDPDEGDNYLMKKEYYALSYNDSKGTPNWVSWHLTLADVGDAPRKPGLSADTELPNGFAVIRHADYTNGGFDRGHMCPHCDRSRTKEMSFSTSIMTNVVPQTAQVNRNAWNQFELYCRMLAVAEGKELYVICGPYGKGGRGKFGFKSELKSKVMVPAECWKIALILDNKGGDDTARVDEDTRVISVLMPNDETVGNEWGGYRTSIREIENLTGYRFLDRIRKDVREQLLDIVNDGDAPTFEVDHGESCLKQVGGDE